MNRFAVLNFDGNVYPCHHVYGNVFGNVYDMSFTDIWNGQQMRKFKNMSFPKESINCCGKCTNKVLHHNLCRCRESQRLAKKIIPILDVIS